MHDSFIASFKINVYKPDKIESHQFTYIQMKNSIIHGIVVEPF